MCTGCQCASAAGSDLGWSCCGCWTSSLCRRSRWEHRSQGLQGLTRTHQCTLQQIPWGRRRRPPSTPPQSPVFYGTKAYGPAPLSHRAQPHCPPRCHNQASVCAGVAMSLDVYECVCTRGLFCTEHSTKARPAWCQLMSPEIKWST